MTRGELVDNTTSKLTVRTFDAETDAQRRLLVSPLRWIKWFLDDIAELSRHHFALRHLVSSQLTVRYQRSTLGFLWTLLNPILHLAVMACIFSVLMNRPLKTYTVYIFAGMLPWQFFSGTLSNNAKSLIVKQSLIRKMYIPKLVFPVADMFLNAITMCFAMTALFLLLQGIRAPIYIQLVLLPPAIVLLMIFSFGLSLILMVLNTFYRDLEHIISVVLRAGFYLSPILWEPLEQLGKNKHFDLAARLNPMYHMLELFHCIFSYGSWPSMQLWLISYTLALVALLVGFLTYKKYEHKLIYRL